MTTVYRIRHKPTGMYFCPSREIKVKLEGDSTWRANGRYIKSNLSKTGKAYVRRPTIKQIGGYYYTHVDVTHVDDLDHGVTGEYRMLRVVPEEWEIEAVE